MSPAWAELAAKAEGVLAHPAPTVLSEIVGAVGEPSAPKQFTLVTRAVIDRTALQAASAWAAQVAQYVHASTGIGVTIGSSAAGQMFVVSWLSSVDTPEELDKLSALGGDAGYLELIAAAGPLFEQGSSERMLLAEAALTGERSTADELLAKDLHADSAGVPTRSLSGRVQPLDVVEFSGVVHHRRGAWPRSSVRRSGSRSG